MARQRLGQHFLVDAGWRARILGTLGVRRDDVWLEIGSGHGEMTSELARAGARVIAVELDPRLVASLHRLAENTPRVQIVAGDILELDLAGLAGASRFRVYGNLPYYITSPILHRLFALAEHIDAIHVVVQLEVAARIAARPGRREYGYLSVLAQFYSQPEILLRLPPGAFRPRPRVASALVRMLVKRDRELREELDEMRFLQFVQACFAQKRKTLLNNLRVRFSDEEAHALLRGAGADAQVRAEELRVAEFVALFRALPH